MLVFFDGNLDVNYFDPGLCPWDLDPESCAFVIRDLDGVVMSRVGVPSYPRPWIAPRLYLSVNWRVSGYPYKLVSGGTGDLRLETCSSDESDNVMFINTANDRTFKLTGNIEYCGVNIVLQSHSSRVAALAGEATDVIAVVAKVTDEECAYIAIEIEGGGWQVFSWNQGFRWVSEESYQKFVDGQECLKWRFRWMSEEYPNIWDKAQRRREESLVNRRPYMERLSRVNEVFRGRGEPTILLMDDHFVWCGRAFFYEKVPVRVLEKKAGISPDNQR